MKKSIVVLILLILAGGSNVGAMKKMSAFDDCYPAWNFAPIYQVLGFVTLCKGGHWNCLKCGNRKYKDYEKIKDHMVEVHGITLLERHDGIDEVYGGRVRRDILGKRKIKYCRLDSDLRPERKRRKRGNKQDKQDMRFTSAASVLSKPRPKKLVQNIQTTQNIKQVEFLSVREPSQQPMLQDFSNLKNVANREILEKNNVSSKRGRRCKYVSMGHMKFVGKYRYQCCYCCEIFPNATKIRYHLDGYRGPGIKRFKNSHSVDVDKHISEQDFTKLKGVANKKVLKKYRVKAIIRQSKYVSNGHMKFLGVRGYQCCYCLKIFQECDGAIIERHLNGYSGPGKKGVKTFHNVDIDTHISEQDFSNLQNVTNQKIFKKYGVYQNLKLFLRYNRVRQKKSRSKYVLNGHMKCAGQKGFECCYCCMQFKDGRRIGRHLDGCNGIGKRVEGSHNVDVDKHISEQDFSKLQNVTNKKKLIKYGNLD